MKTIPLRTTDEKEMQQMNKHQDVPNHIF